MIYFASDVHLGLRQGNPAEREAAFLKWLKDIPHNGETVLWLLGDIWDFWYEYRDVVPKEGLRVVAELASIAESGAEVNFVPGNHDIWCFSYFEKLGIHKVEGPAEFEYGGKRFFVAHGDCLGPTRWSYRFMISVFRNRVCQALFSLLHPWLAFRFGTDWSEGNRKTHPKYVWKGEDEPLYKYAVEHNAAAEKKADVFVFGHLHVRASETLPDGSAMEVLDSWVESNPSGSTPFVVFGGER